MNIYKRMTGFLVLLLMLFSSTFSNAVEMTTYYHNDLLGSPVAATDEFGFQLWTENYSSYGERKDNPAAAVNNKVGYTGKAHDGTTGLTYFGARYYDPVIGRFMGMDPAGVSESNPHTFNRYAYANNNPYRYVDPDGREQVSNLVDTLISAESRLRASAGAAINQGYSGLGFIGEALYRMGGPMQSIPIGTKVGPILKGAGLYLKGFSKGSTVAKGLAKVPGRVQSRINLSNKGVDHVLGTHLNPAKAGNKSQFTLSGSEVRSLLGSKSTVRAPARALETGNFARTITSNRTVGNLANKMGGGSTKTFTVITDKFGNLQSAFPGGL